MRTRHALVVAALLASTAVYAQSTATQGSTTDQQQSATQTKKAPKHAKAHIYKHNAMDSSGSSSGGATFSRATSQGAVDCNLAGRAGMPGCPNDDFSWRSSSGTTGNSAMQQTMPGSMEPNATLPNATMPQYTLPPRSTTSGTSTTGSMGSSTVSPPPPIIDPALPDAVRNRSDRLDPAGRMLDERSTTTPPPPPRQY